MDKELSSEQKNTLDHARYFLKVWVLRLDLKSLNIQWEKKEAAWEGKSLRLISATNVI